MHTAEPVPPIDLSIETSADADTVWRHLTDPDWVVLWFTEASPVGAVGSPYRLDFGDGSVVTGTILTIEPPRRLAYSWTWDSSDATEVTEVTAVTWMIEPLDSQRTTVRIVHDGWAEAGMDASARDDHATYWAGYLDDLRDVLAEA